MGKSLKSYFVVQIEMIVALKNTIGICHGWLYLMETTGRNIYPKCFESQVTSYTYVGVLSVDCSNVNTIIYCLLGIPTLIILDKDGEVINTSGRVAISHDPDGKV